MIIMKKLLLLLVLLSSASFVIAQASRWFFTFSAGPGFGGPAAGIKSNMAGCGFNDKSSWNILGFTGTNDYPYIDRGLPVLFTAGRKIKEYKSMYLTAGVSATGTVSGMKSFGFYDAILFSGNYGNAVTIDYQVWQLTAGYQYHFPKTRAKLGFGPTALLFRYKEEEEGTQYNKPVPGVSGMVRLPFGRERKLFGMELFAQALLAPPIKTIAYTKGFEHNGQKYSTTLKESTASMCQFMAGISFSVRDVISHQKD